MNSWAWHESCELFHELHGCELHRGGAIVPGLLELVDDLASDVRGKAFFTEGRPSDVPAESL